MANRRISSDWSATRSIIGGIAACPPQPNCYLAEPDLDSGDGGSPRSVVSGVGGIGRRRAHSKPDGALPFSRRARIRLRRIIGERTSLTRVATSDPAAAGRALP
jgi:hypothetical protein